MHKYQLEVEVLAVGSMEKPFRILIPETTFIAVTSYQSQEVCRSPCKMKYNLECRSANLFLVQLFTPSVLFLSTLSLLNSRLSTILLQRDSVTETFLLLLLLLLPDFHSGRCHLYHCPVSNTQ